MKSIAENLKSATNEEKQTNDLPSENIVSNVPDPVGTHVWTGTPADITLPGVVQCAQERNVQTLRHQCQCQPPQDQLQYADYLLYPQSQQFNLLTGPLTEAGDCSQPSASSWFTSEPILCSMMPGEIHTSDSNVCLALAIDHQHLEEELLIDNNHLTHSMLFNGNSSGQVLLMNPDPGPVFLTLENAPVHTNDSMCREKVVATLPQSCSAGAEDALELFYAAQGLSDNCRDVTALGTHNQVVCPLDSSEHIVDIHLQAPGLQTVRTTREMRSRKPCHCTRSKCLKLYCECFANGVMCSNCDCSNCHNNVEHEVKRGKAIKSCLVRNPDAFRPKIAGGKLGEVKGWHSKGCNCKRSGCLKNYCECYEANIMCTSSCKCVGCRNYDGGSATSLTDKTFSEQDKGPVSVITPAVVEAVCGCLMARAEEAERDFQSETSAQHMILNEFGHCLAQIVEAMFKN